MVARPLPLPLTRPAPNVCTVRYAVLPTTLWPTIRTPQSLTLIFVFCLTTVPFCPVIVVGIISGLAQRFAERRQRGVRADRQVHRDAADTGTSGVDANVVVVMPFLMSVLPTRIDRHAVAFEDQVEVREGGAAVRDEDRRPGHLARQRRRDDRRAADERPARAVQRVGRELRFGARFLQRRQTRGQRLGQRHLDRLDVRLTGAGSDRRFRLAPLALRGLRAGRRLERRLEFQRAAVADLERATRCSASRSPPRPARSRAASSRSPAGCSWSG